MHELRASIRVRARALIGVTDLISQFGGDCGILFRELGLSTELLSTPEATIDHLKIVQLYEQAAKRFGIKDFGLRLAELQGLSVLGPVALTAQHAATVGDAIAAVSRNIPYHSPGAEVRLTMESDGDQVDARSMACLRYELHLPRNTEHQQNSELAYAIAVRFLSMAASVSPLELTGWHLNFEHRIGLTARQYRQYLGCEVRLGQSFDALYFPQTILDAPINAANPTLVDIAQRFVSLVMRRYPLDISMQVETLLVRQLASGGCNLPRIATQLSMSVSSLQRRLSEDNVSFDEILDRVRKARAYEYLRQTDLALTQIASLLGYTESSSFSRSCKRWFGSTPLTVRSASHAIVNP